jgi:hypothetical protein
MAHSRISLLPYAFVAIGRAYGGILVGTGLTLLRHDRALVAHD